MTYTDYICGIISAERPGAPIYTSKIAEGLAKTFGLNKKAAAAATSVAVKRVMDGKVIEDLRFYQKGIYYRTVKTPFGELGIDKERLIAEKYILPDLGYDTGAMFLYHIGLTTQLPRERVIATNAATDGTRTDEKLGVTIRPPKLPINAENRSYLQLLDALDGLDKAPVDAEQPYSVLARHIRHCNLSYEKLLYYADRHYSKNTILRLAHTAQEGGELS